MRIAQIGVHPSPQRAGALGLALGHALHHARRAIAPGTFHRGGQERIARREMRVKPAMRQPGFLHDVGHAHAGIPFPPDGARRGVNNPFVRKRFAV
ncbi:hypothetical protein D3C87_1574710 [compost metagenome]